VAARIALVVAMADNGVIGDGGRLPWHLPDDLKHFKAITLGKPVLMGRRTYESIGRALPERRNLVLTSGTTPLPAGVETVTSIEAARARECVAVSFGLEATGRRYVELLEELTHGRHE